MKVTGPRLHHDELHGSEWDVVVVGAGPAGSRAAEAAAKGGAKVLILERRKEVGLPVQCAEFLHRKVVDELEVPSDVISQEVTGMVTYVKGGTVARTRSPGCILDRARFDRMLALRADEAGAVLLLNTSYDRHKRLEKGASGLLCHGYHIIDEAVGSNTQKSSKKGFEVSAKVIIGADGPNSKVGQTIGQRSQKELSATQVTVELHEAAKETEVFLDPIFAGGYGWLFPKGKLANVGVGMDLALDKRLKEALKRLLSMLQERIGGEVSRTGGTIPVGGPLDCSIDNVLLCGDAGGFTHPITGGGIHQAVTTGRFAGEAAARHVNGDKDSSDWYVDECETLFGRNLGHAVERRREMVDGWKGASKDVGAFEKLMRRCWIGFKEYNQP